MITSYRTIEGIGEGIYKEKGSKFLSFACHVKSEEDIRDRIDALKKEYFDARHHCYAWQLGADKKHFRAFDDGEPNHSAGDPILGQIRSRDVTNVLVVVVRYFGGVKLGVGGLIAAYKAAAAMALERCYVIDVALTERWRFIYDYAATAEVMRLVRDFNLQILNQSFEDKCRMEFEVHLGNNTVLQDRVNTMQLMGIPLDLQPIR